MGRCQYAIDTLPTYTPQLIAFLIALLEFIIVAIAYIARETQRKKTFYGREDFEDIPEEEKMEHEGAIMGKNNEELRIVQSADRTVEAEPGSIATPSAGGVKVMVRRRKARSALLSNRDDSTKAKQTTANAMSIRFTLDVDRTARGFEFINLIQKSLEEVDEFRNIVHKLTDDAEDRLCDFLVRKVRSILEESTQRKWVVHGVIQNKMWKVNGQENLLEQGGDIRTQQMLRITAQGPMTPIIILAYMIEVDVRPSQVRTHAAQSPVPHGITSRSRMPMESATQSVSRTYGKTPVAMHKYFSPSAPKLATPVDVTNYFTTLRTMSTLPSEKLPPMMDTMARSRGSRNKDARSSASTKFTPEAPRSNVRSSKIIKQRRRTLSSASQAARRSSTRQALKSPATNKRATSTDTETRSRPRSAKSTDKLSTDPTQSVH